MIDFISDYGIGEQENYEFSKLKEFIKLEDFDYKEEIKEKGYISEDSALKIVAIKEKDDIKINILDASIELRDEKSALYVNSEKYWVVSISYKEQVKGSKTGVIYYIDYYTGEIIECFSLSNAY